MAQKVPCRLSKRLAVSDPLVMAFCQVVHERREFLRISQEEVAHRAGLHRTYISDIERGSRNLSLKNLGRMAGALELSVSDLLFAAEVRAMSLGMLKDICIQSTADDEWAKRQVESTKTYAGGQK